MKKYLLIFGIILFLTSCKTHKVVVLANIPTTDRVYFKIYTQSDVIAYISRKEILDKLPKYIDEIGKTFFLDSFLLTQISTNQGQDTEIQHCDSWAFRAFFGDLLREGRVSLYHLKEKRHIKKYFHKKCKTILGHEGYCFFEKDEKYCFYSQITAIGE